MKNREAARYARWSAAVAVAIALAVLVVYLQRRRRGITGEKNMKAVPASVAQQSAGFTFSRNIGAQTLFTVHAEQATQFKDANRSLLENVSIRIFGARGERDDSVRADECSYEPDTGSIRCHGVVQIILRNAEAPTGVSANAKNGGELQLQTSDILFERDSGKVSTDKPVALDFRDGQGSADGVLYDPETENVTLEKNVELKIAARKNARGGAASAVNLTGASLEFERKENLLRVTGPVRAEQDGRILHAGEMELQLDSQMHPAIARANGNPEITATNERGAMKFASGRMTGEFSQSGALEKITAADGARGAWNGSAKHGAAKSDFSAQTAELLLTENHGASEPRELLARGNVNASMAEGRIRRKLATDALQMNFAASESGRGSHIVRAETLAPAEITSDDAKESSRIHGGKLEAAFSAQSELKGLDGSGGIEIARAIAGKPPQTSSAQQFSAEFARSGEWENIEERGGVKFSENGRTGRADAASFSRASNEATLAGAASVEDADSRLQAETIRINQTTGEVHASGEVVASYFGKNKTGGALKNAVNMSADEMNGTGATKSAASNGHAVFSGNARMWEATSVLQADTIELWRGEQRAEARGNVNGEFVEAAHKSASQKRKDGSNAPVLWRVQAAKVNYSSNTGKMEWSGGVKAHSTEGDISSDTLELSFAAGANNKQTLQRALAGGGVRIEQNGRTGTAERGEYIASEGKFVLFGGQPAIADASGNRTTGRELTFFLANDSILVDSQNDRASEKLRKPER